jgi:hypothetical protein
MEKREGGGKRRKEKDKWMEEKENEFCSSNIFSFPFFSFLSRPFPF